MTKKQMSQKKFKKIKKILKEVRITLYIIILNKVNKWQCNI